jgi:nicotinic acid mononucleotide adenylyltransferase
VSPVPRIMTSKCSKLLILDDGVQSPSMGKLCNILSPQNFASFSSLHLIQRLQAMAKASVADDKRTNKKAGNTTKVHQKAVKASTNPTPISSKEILEKAVRPISLVVIFFFKF